jgi:hypothetical protein
MRSHGVAILLRARLRNNCWPPLTLRFADSERSEGHGIVMRCMDDRAAFHTFRMQVLGTSRVRPQHPHLTFAHPRNPKAPGNTLAVLAPLIGGWTITCTEIVSMTQQGDEPWQIQERYRLLSAHAQAASGTPALDQC